METESALERAYRRLLLAYPRRYRRERGTEILTTLLDAARPGQRRPAARDALDLVLGGLRRRLAVPRGPLPGLAATLVALLAAVATPAGAGWVSWRTTAATPDLAAAREAVDSAIARPPVRDPLHYDQPFDLAGEGRFDPASARIGYSYAVPPSAIPAEVAAARDRLAAAGWEVTPVRDDGGLLDFWAARDGTIVHIGGYPLDPGASEPLWADVHTRAPGWFAPLVLAGAGAGALAGWLCAGWALRRCRRDDGRLRPVVVVFGGLGLLAGVPVLLSTAYHGVAATAAGGWSTMDAMFPAVALSRAQPLSLFAGAWLLVAALAAALPPRPGRGVQPWRLGLWSAATAHLAFAGAWCFVVALYLTRLATSGGDRQGMLGGAYDPKDLVPFGVGPLNPFAWGYSLVSLLFLLGFLASPGLLGLSVPLLVASRRTVTPAAGRTAWRVLLVAAATALALPLMTATPLGRDALTWWLD
ncbi:hypothetical protein GCM10023170_023500 [Phytohabitans houttuyneae]|uniref:hypothetical protein n=1 Tax=Phytohabitans houttuyneae TaxID=1076126 RepID=UPI0031EDA3F5